MKWRRNSVLILFEAHIHKNHIELIFATIDVFKGVANYRLDYPIIWSEAEVFLAKVSKFLTDVYRHQTCQSIAEMVTKEHSEDPRTSTTQKYVYLLTGSHI